MTFAPVAAVASAWKRAKSPCSGSLALVSIETTFAASPASMMNGPPMYLTPTFVPARSAKPPSAQLIFCATLPDEAETVTSMPVGDVFAVPCAPSMAQ